MSYGRSARAFKASAPMMMMENMGGGASEEGMSFEPEPIEISAQVRVQFALAL